MKMAEYDTFINKNFEDLKDEEEIVGVIRDLTPGKKKYKCLCARFVISKDPNRYPDRLWIRLGRGQLVKDHPCSVKILELLKPY
jgi:hypothetical protein